MTDDQSPDMLRPDAGVRRLNRRPLAIALIALGAGVFALAYGILAKNRKIRRASPDRERHIVQTSNAPAAALTRNAPKSGPIPEKTERFRSGPRAGLIIAPEAPPEMTAKRAEADDEAEQRRRIAARRAQMLDTAMTASTHIATVESLSTHRAESPPLEYARVRAPTGSSPLGAGSSASELARLMGGEDPNRQSEKQKFADQNRTVGYLPSLRQMPLSPFEVKAGTIIPAVLVSGINSDLPGQIIAQVSQNVYDSASGDHLLIPQGSRLVGIYDSHVSVGQSRVQVVWTRLNFPDASTLDLGAMPGTDQSGYGGFHDRVNNHVMRIFRDALMLSLISAGAQLSQPRARSDQELTAEQQIAAAMGQQFGAAGMEMTKRNMQIQPTLEIRPGYRFAVMVNKDVVLPPYGDPRLK